MIGLLTSPGSYATDALVASKQVPLHSVDTHALGLPHYECPYGLPAIASGEVLLLTSGWLLTLHRQGIDVIERLLIPGRQRFPRIIVLDQSDPFLLCIDNAVLDHVDAVIKVNGTFRDPDLNNFVVGSLTSNGQWTQKDDPKPHKFSNANLDKVHIGIPCFLSVGLQLRARTRPYYEKSLIRCYSRNLIDYLLATVSRPLSRSAPPKQTVHFIASLTHAQRFDAMRRLNQSGLAWKGGITSVPKYIAGWSGKGIMTVSEAERNSIIKQIADEKIAAQPLNRLQYVSSMMDCKAVLSITGYGEICFRMAEAWSARRILVCQNMSHAATLFPLQEGRNVIYCKPDLSDLSDVLEDIEVNFSRYIDVAEQGHQDWMAWSSRFEGIIRSGFSCLYE